MKKKKDAVNFDTRFDFSLKINPGLTTIIGNKGSGKSALADLIGYIGGTDNNSSFSFLSKDRFCKEDKLFNLDYCGKMTWFDNEKLGVSNFDLSNKSDICYVRYLPQRFIEDTCNNLDKRFQIEIDKVIYSYIDKKDREQTINLSELIEIKEKKFKRKD
ncbi:AAA family ATPase [Erysipelatoclostridium sp. An173]|uniref:AAA family ATPase n=1 Tax=Erysipelatoclostridium sp. An173 TaxID=1965571 RepID=UPI0032096EAD